MPVIDAYMRVFRTRDRFNASCNGSRLLSKLQVTMQQHLEAAGVTKSALATTIKEGLTATKYVKSVANFQPDHEIRHKYTETALRLTGHGKDGKPDAQNKHTLQIGILREDGTQTIIRSDAP